MKRLCAILSLITVMSSAVAGTAAAHASPTEAAIALHRRIGPPLTRTSMRGEVFGPSETVDVAFDGTDIASAQTNEDGVFTARIVVPRTAHPGSHDVVATGVTSGLTAQTNFLVRSDWSTERGGPDRLGRNSVENVLNPGNAAAVTERWVAPTSGGVHSSPVVAGEFVYVGTKRGDLVAVNRFTGEQAWSFHTTSHDQSPPTIVRGVLFFGSGDVLFALDARTGHQLWSFGLAFKVDASPAVVDGVVYVSGYDSADADLQAIDAATGTELWRFNPEPYGHFSAPAVADGLVYAGSVEKIYAVDAATGIERWEYDTSYWVFEFAPAVENGTLYVASSDGNVYAFDAMTGDLLWKTQCDAGSSPAISGGIVYVNGTYAAAVDAATGELLWRKYIFAVKGDPVVANGVVYLPVIDKIYLVREQSGMMIGVIHVPGSRSEGPTVIDGMVYVGSTDWHLYAFGLPSHGSLEGHS